MRKGPSLAAAVLLVVLGLAPAIAQDGKFSQQQLDQMLAPIALYPDDLLTNVLSPRCRAGGALAQRARKRAA
jgi:Protein of unknown function (DUF3300)